MELMDVYSNLGRARSDQIQCDCARKKSWFLCVLDSLDFEYDQPETVNARAANSEGAWTYQLNPRER